jgi:hypothetical protein
MLVDERGLHASNLLLPSLQDHRHGLRVIANAKVGNRDLR